MDTLSILKRIRRYRKFYQHAKNKNLQFYYQGYIDSLVDILQDKTPVHKITLLWLKRVEVLRTGRIFSNDLVEHIYKETT